MTQRRKLHNLIAIAVLLAIAIIIGIFGDVGVTYAANADAQTFEQTNVMDDLKGSTINGEQFDLSDYPFNKEKKPQLLSFVEYSYSFKTEKLANYGLFIYVYNPQGLAIDTATDRNKIQFAHGNNSNFEKYSLTFLNRSTQAGYEGLFYKFKVKLSNAQRANIFNKLNQNSRVYEVSGLELSVKRAVTEYGMPGNKTLSYTYSGFAKGCGSDLSNDDTLTCTVNGLRETLHLNVQSTYWRPEGTHTDGYTRDTLHSVYFAVPNEKIEAYGEMTAVHAKWLNAYTAPIFVTGNSDIYKALMPYVGEYVDGGTLKDYKSDLEYTLVATKAVGEAKTAPAAAAMGHYAYNAYSDFNGSNHETYDKYLYYLNYLFLAENDDADNYTLSSEQLINWFETFTEKFGGDLVNDKFSKSLFEKVDANMTDVTIESTDEYKLTDNTVSDNVWTRLFGGSLKKEHSYNISAIQKVTSKDIKFYSDKTAFCDKFYIAEVDYDDFSSYVKSSEKENKTVYLFRYYQSEYVSNEATEFKRTTEWTIVTGKRGYYKGLDTNAYFAQEWVQLDFDIIDLTFTKDAVKTVIPVVMSPTDIVAGVDPPADTTSGEGFDFWQWLLQQIKKAPWWVWLIVGLVALSIILPILSAIFPAFGAILSIVLKAVGKVLLFIVKAIGYVLYYLALGIWYIVASPGYLIAFLVKRRAERTEAAPTAEDAAAIGETKELNYGKKYERQRRARKGGGKAKKTEK